jgi:gluconokinase
VLPFLTGERSTGWNPLARGAVIGLRPHTSSLDILQAGLEAVAYRFAAVKERLRGAAPVDAQVIATGGALIASAAWCQIIADVLGRDVRLVEVQEASLTGAVLLVLETIGKIENIEKNSADRGKVFKPNLRRHKIYQEARKKHKKFYNLIINEQ